MKYRPSKGFVLIVLPLAVLVVSLGFGLLPELEEFKAQPIPGEIIFKNAKPQVSRTTTVSARKSASFGWSMEWLEEGYENVMSWDKNPWKTKFPGFGDHYSKLLESKDPIDIARAKELRRLADVLHKRLLERYPELAVAGKNVPPERNGFLKWLELAERLCPPGQGTDAPSSLKFPDDLKKHFNGEGPWNAETAKAWLGQLKPVLDEIRAIGLMPEQSIEGIDVHRWAFINARLVKAGSEALLIEARLAAENGDAAAALEAIQASNGIAAHMANVETPSLLAVTVQILLQMQTQKYAFTEIMPALPPGQLDPVAWEKALNPTVPRPAEFARIMKGEWNVISREYLLPPLVDAEEPKSPPDPDALLDVYAGYFINVVQEHEGRAIPDWPNIPESGTPDISHLSHRSQKVLENFFIGARAWRNGMQRSLSAAAMTQAAFAIMKGEPIPNDPIYNQPYIWDPATRKLSQPTGEVFQKLDLKPITVPKP